MADISSIKIREDTVKVVSGDISAVDVGDCGVDQDRRWVEGEPEVQVSEKRGKCIVNS